MYRCLFCFALITLTLSSTYAADDGDISIINVTPSNNNTELVNEDGSGLVNVSTIDLSNATIAANMSDVNMPSITTSSPTPTSPSLIDPSTLRSSLLDNDPDIIIKPSPELDVALFLDTPHNPEVDDVGDNIETTPKPVKKHKTQPTTATPTISSTNTTPTQEEKSGPIFVGFQGQSFIFHGLADEVFNLISTPSFQLNAHLTYIASGDCTYNETQCFTNPGTYMDQLGFLFGSNLTIKLTASSHQHGLIVDIMSNRIKPRQYPKGLRMTYTNTSDDVVMIRYETYNRITITTSQMQFVVMNSDGFMNIQVSLLDGSLLQLGARPYVLSDAQRCAPMTTTTSEDDISTPTIKSSNREWMEKELETVYGKSPMLGLIGATWRAATICGKPWMGTTGDYVCSSIFATDYVYRLYHSTSTSTQFAMDDV